MIYILDQPPSIDYICTIPLFYELIMRRGEFKRILPALLRRWSGDDGGGGGGGWIIGDGQHIGAVEVG